MQRAHTHTYTHTHKQRPRYPHAERSRGQVRAQRRCCQDRQPFLPKPCPRPWAVVTSCEPHTMRVFRTVRNKREVGATHLKDSAFGLSPTHKLRKFSHVFGAASHLNANTIRPAEKFLDATNDKQHRISSGSQCHRLRPLCPPPLSLHVPAGAPAMETSMKQCLILSGVSRVSRSTTATAAAAL
jgi:hypothetical protein